MFRTARHLKGFALEAKDGEIGRVSDLYFDDLYWQLRYFAVDTAKGLKHRSVLISPESIHAPDWKTQRLPVDLTREQVEQSPGLESDQPVSRQYETVLRKHYAWPPYWGTVYGSVGMSLPGPEENPGDEPKGDPHLFSVNATRGHHVAATDGEIGHVDDFLIDDRPWVVRYLIVATRNWWPGKKVVLSPWWTSEVNWLERRISLDLSRNAIKTSPPYESEAAFTAEASGELHDHYGRMRYPGEEVGESILRNDNPNYP